MYSLLTDMSDYILNKIDPAAKKTVARTATSMKATPPAVPSSGKNSRYIPVSIKREVYRRDQGHCTYRDPITHKRCQFQHFLQIDHVTLFSAGTVAGFSFCAEMISAL